jgi:hypothetical protein
LAQPFRDSRILARERAETFSMPVCGNGVEKLFKAIYRRSSSNENQFPCGFSFRYPQFMFCTKAG